MSDLRKATQKAINAIADLDRGDAIAVLRVVIATIPGLKLRDSDSTEARQTADRRTTKRRQSPDSRPTDGRQNADSEAAPLVDLRSSSKKVAAKKTTTKPKVSLQPTEDETRVIRALNSQRARLVPGDLGYDANDSANIVDLRKLLGRFTVVDCETVIEWWPTRKGSFPGWKAIDHLRPATVFNGKKFPDYVNRARAWKVGRDDIEYDNDALWRETMARGES